MDGDAGEKSTEPTLPSPLTSSPTATSPPPVKSNGEGLREAELRLEFERGLHRIDTGEKASQAKHALHKYGVT